MSFFIAKRDWSPRLASNGGINGGRKNMKKVKMLLFLLAVCLLGFSQQASAHPGHGQDVEEVGKKAILVISFGTSVPRAEKGITNLVDVTKKAFPGYEVRLAYTSNIIRKKIAAERKLYIPTPFEALAALNDEGYTHVYAMPMHMIPGVEYDGIKSLTDAVALIHGKYSFSELRLGEPFMATIQQCEQVADALIKRFSKELSKDKTAIVLMGHGSPEHFSHALYAQLQLFLDMKAPSRFFIGTVEVSPVIEDVAVALKKSGNDKIVLSPLMIVAGDHSINDMADPEDAESWLNILKSAGYSDISVRQEGLGEDPLFAGIFINNLKKLIK